jgi:hypothetical protein
MHRFRVTVESLAEDGGGTMEFEVENHDDIVAIAGRAPSRFGLDEDASRALVIGYKLLGEVVLKKRAEEPFASLRPAMGEFGKALKKSGTEQA